MQKFDLSYESRRLNFYLERDGVDKAIESANLLILIYRKAALALKAKGRKKDEFRFKYLE